MSDAKNPFSDLSGAPLITVSPIHPAINTPPTPIKVEITQQEKTDVATEKAKIISALEKENTKVQQDREANKATTIKHDEAKAERPLKYVAVEGQIYNAKLKRIESILRRNNQSISKMLQDIDTVIKE